MSENTYFFTISLFFLTIILIFGMRYVAAIQQARARLANDDAYRQLAASAAASQADTAARLASIDANVAEVRARLGVVEKVLKEVE